MKILLSTALLFLCTTIYADEAYSNGEELFNEAKCMECHNTGDFKKDEKKVKNTKVLFQKVQACALNSEAEWFDEDMDDVVHYLNKKHYKFENTK